LHLEKFGRNEMYASSKPPSVLLAKIKHEAKLWMLMGAKLMSEIIPEKLESFVILALLLSC
jgi:hypothetical protein